MSFKDINKRMCAVELFSSSVCNLNCSYCYIPKNKEMSLYHKKILEKLEDGTFIENLKALYGNDLEYLGLWGTEQTLILDRFIKIIDKYFEAFPKIREVSFSSNLIAFPERIVELSKAVDKYAKRNVVLKWQVSIDGPEWVNDVGRGEGATKKILENLDIYFNLIKDVELRKTTISFSLKPTVAIEFMEIMNDDFDKLIEWYKFFDDIVFKINEIIKGSKIEKRISMPDRVTPTLVVPGKYSVEDGKTLARFFRNIMRLEKLAKSKKDLFHYNSYPLNGYVNRLANIIQNYHDISLRPQNGTCSGGDTQFGLNLEGYMFPCHRLFLFDNEDYLRSIFEGEKDINEWDVSKFSEGIVRNVKKYLVVNKNSTERNIARYFYTLRGYHDNLAYKVSTTVSQIYELALAGQASRKYLECRELTELLALFLNTRMSCPIENYLQSGSLHLPPISITRLFANGAFEVLLENYYELRGEW